MTTFLITVFDRKDTDNPVGMFGMEMDETLSMDDLMLIAEVEARNFSGLSMPVVELKPL